MPRFHASMPASAVGADEVHMDFWNGSAEPVELEDFFILPDGSTAVTGAVAIALFLTRTSAVGTGGTAFTAEGATLSAGAISKADSGSKGIPAGISARDKPTGGATAGAIICQRQVHPEETSPQAPVNMLDGKHPLIIPPASGFRIVQSAIASVAAVIFHFTFATPE